MDRLVTVAWTPPSAKRRKSTVPGSVAEGSDSSKSQPAEKKRVRRDGNEVTYRQIHR
jgi:hypothetical protein